MLDGNPTGRDKFWLLTASKQDRNAVTAAFAGYGVDAFDYMGYTFVISTLIATWGLTSTQAGWIATASLLASAFGGWAAGILSDRFGRVRILQATVLCFALFTFLSGCTTSYHELLATRTLQGLGFGGEWSVGSVLVSEIVRAKHRGKAAGFVQSSWAVGWGLAAIAYSVIFTFVGPDLAWRVLFWLGILPAVLVLWIRRTIGEPEVYVESRRASTASAGSFLAIFAPSMIATTLLATVLSTGLMGAYYSITTWLPTFFKEERHLSVLNTGGYLLVLIAGSFVGYLTSAHLNDRLGRRPCFMIFAICAGVLVMAYTHIPVGNGSMLVLGFPLGFFLSGIFSGMGAFLSELFPTAIRGSGQGFCYNAGRAIGSFFPVGIGYCAQHYPLGATLGVFAGVGYLVVLIAALFLPETRGRSLVEVATERTSAGMAMAENA